MKERAESKRAGVARLRRASGRVANAAAIVLGGALATIIFAGHSRSGASEEAKPKVSRAKPERAQRAVPEPTGVTRYAGVGAYGARVRLKSSAGRWHLWLDTPPSTDCWPQGASISATSAEAWGQPSHAGDVKLSFTFTERVQVDGRSVRRRTWVQILAKRESQRRVVGTYSRSDTFIDRAAELFTCAREGAFSVQRV